MTDYCLAHNFYVPCISCVNAKALEWVNVMDRRQLGAIGGSIVPQLALHLRFVGIAIGRTPVGITSA